MNAIGNRSRRRPWRVALSALVFWAALEAGAYVFLSVREGEPFSWKEARAAQEAVVASQRDGNDRTQEAAPSHPYLGFLERMVSIAATDRDFATLNDPAFYAPESPVFSRDADTVLVGIVGGSVAGNFTWRSKGTETLSRVLASDPRFAGKQVRFARMAYGGCKQPQQFFALTYLLALGGSVDVLINLDGFNEVALHETENANQGVAPIYPRAWLLRQMKGGRVGELRMEIAAIQARTQRLAESALRSPLHWSPLYQLVWRLRNAQLNEAFLDAGSAVRASGALEDEAAQFDRGGPTYTFANEDAMYDELVDIWVRCSIQLDRLCRANGIRYFHFLQPNQYVKGSKPPSDEERKVAYSVENPYYPGATKGYPRLMARGADLRAAGVLYLDLTDSFADVEESIYMDACCHVNEEGDRILGERIARFVLDHWD